MTKNQKPVPSVIVSIFDLAMLVTIIRLNECTLSQYEEERIRRLERLVNDELKRQLRKFPEDHDTIEES